MYITGTTRGLGKALYERIKHFSNVFDAPIGLDRPAFDLDVNIDDFVKDDFDVYINNAYSGWQQVELLYKLFNANRERECIILSVGSVSADGDRKEVNPYAIHKKALDHACTQLQLVKSKCRVIQVKLGRVDTDLVHHIKSKKMNVHHVAREISNIIHDSQHNGMYVKTITIDNHGD